MSDKFEARLRIQNKIRATIPLSDSMKFSILSLEANSIEVNAPLSENFNIHGTGFAGSIYSTGILAGWALCYYNMELFEMSGDLVVGKAEIIYKSPLTEDIFCTAALESNDRIVFDRDFKSKGKSSIRLNIKIGESENAILQADYFAIATKF